jgi:uncharacterized protein (DUF2062 family)
MFVGARLTGHRIPPGFRDQVTVLFEQQSLFSGDFWHQLLVLFRPFLAPYTVGSLIGCVALSALAYPLALAFVTSRRRLRHLIHSKD